jgi:hypothetical protein
VFSHLILDDFGEPLRGFKSKREALWFIEDKPGLTIQATGYKPEKIPAVDPYEQAMIDCGPAPF